MPIVLSSRQPTKIVKENIDGQVVNVRTTEGMQGAPALTIELNDPEWLITNSDVLDLDTNGKLDHVETDYRGETWRLVEVSPNNDDLSLTLESRIVSILRSYHKPKRHRRVKGYTRAMFIKLLVDEAAADGHDIEFSCPRLHDDRRIKKGKVPRATADRTGTKGITKADAKKLRIRGKAPTSAQLKNAETVLEVADRMQAPRRAVIALIEACIDESNMTNPSGGDRDSGGILQVRRSVHPKVNVLDIEQCVSLFLAAGFSGKGGAITLANTTTLPPHMIAQDVQGSATADGSNYKQFEGEAKAWVAAYHVLADPNSGDTVNYTTDSAYFFGRGYDSSGGVIKGEDSWTAMNRLASEVNWRVFVRGNTVYFISDYDLFKQKPLVSFGRDSGRMIDTSFDWDEGKPVNDLELTVQRQDIRHGHVIEMNGVGPASGRWLVWEVTTEATGGFSNLTCRTPQAAKAEPAPDTQAQSVTVGGKKATKRKSDVFGTLIKAMKLVTDKQGGYKYGGGHGPAVGSLPATTHFDCSSSVSWVLNKAGIFPGTSAWTSGEFASRYGKPGKGKFFTVWANADHVWIQLHVGPYWRFDTSQHSVICTPQHPNGVPSGAALVKTARSTAGFTPRHWPGL
jgi:hypothetical protein